MTRMFWAAFVAATVLMGGVARAEFSYIDSVLFTANASRPAPITQEACLKRAEQGLSQQGFDVVARSESRRTGHGNGYSAEIICEMHHGVVVVIIAGEISADGTRFRDALVDYMKAAVLQ